MIVDDIYTLRECLDAYRKVNQDTPIVLTSLPGDPIHDGHLSLLEESAKLGHLVVVVNGDEFLINKKGYVFMPLAVRMRLIDSLKAVKFVVPYFDGTQFVAGAIEILKPDLYTKGGDRSFPEMVAEAEKDACRRVHCRIIYGVGGSGKANSSSHLVERACEALLRHRQKLLDPSGSVPTPATKTVI